VNFEAYLISKKIDSDAFKQAEGNLWSLWQTEFEHLHPNSFTSQKLYLINPIRRKYPLKVGIKPPVEKISPSVLQPATRNAQPETLTSKPETLNVEPGTTETSEVKSQTSKPVVPRPVFKQPRPKIN